MTDICPGDDASASTPTTEASTAAFPEQPRMTPEEDGLLRACSLSSGSADVELTFEHAELDVVDTSVTLTPARPQKPHASASRHTLEVKSLNLEDPPSCELGSPEETLARELQSTPDAPESKPTFASRPRPEHPCKAEGAPCDADIQSRPPWAGAPRQGWQCAPAPTAYRPPPLPQLKLVLVSDRLDLLIAPGDVLCVQGRGRLMEIGAAGGFMGHVLVITSMPRSIPRGSPEAYAFSNAWPPEAAEIWVVRTIESTRREQGLYEVDSLLYVQRDTGKLMLFGEISKNDEIGLSDDPDPVELFQSPGELRAQLRIDLIADVVDGIRNILQNWSAATAARALLRRGSQTLSGDSAQIMEDMIYAWTQDPICTSVVVIFWQMYLQRFAQAVNIDPAAMIMKFMPLKADRVLPGPLLKTMKDHGFIALSRVPKVFKSVPAMPSMFMEPPPQPPQLPPLPNMELALQCQRDQELGTLVTSKKDSEPPISVGEQVVYWSDTMGQWVDAVVKGHCHGPQGQFFGYDLDVKPMADVHKVRRAAHKPSQHRPSADNTSPGEPAPFCQSGPSQPRPMPQNRNPVMPPCGDAASLSALIANAVDEGWFSAIDMEVAMRACRAKGAAREVANSPTGFFNSTVAL